MMRPRFSSGLVLGLAIGMPVGALILLFALPHRAGMSPEQQRDFAQLQSDVTAMRESTATGGEQLEGELRDALGQLAQERERTKTQIGLFEELAAQVSANLAKIETRMEALERRAQQAAQPAPAPAPANRYPERAPADSYPRERRYDDRWE